MSDAKRDCLGRPIRPDPDPPAPTLRTLTDDQVNAIAEEVRTKPLAEVGRHVMPLIQHIAEQADVIHDLIAACELWDQGFIEGQQFTPEQLLAWVNANRRAARAAIAKAKGGSA
jgi:hypothetical protein